LRIGADAADFYDVTIGNSTQPTTGIPGFPATSGRCELGRTF
jgi:hypothetical protein